MVEFAYRPRKPFVPLAIRVKLDKSPQYLSTPTSCSKNQHPAFA
jgi:hypothetical protein